MEEVESGADDAYNKGTDDTSPKENLMPRNNDETEKEDRYGGLAGGDCDDIASLASDFHLIGQDESRTNKTQYVISKTVTKRKDELGLYGGVKKVLN